MTARTRLAVLLVSTPLVAVVLIGGFLGKTSAREDSYQHLRVFEDVVSLVLNSYVEDVKVDRVMDGAMRGLAESLDADSSWLSVADVQRIERGTPLPDGDTGLVITRQYYLRVVGVRDGSAAARAGIRTGDYVRGIDGKPTRDLSIIDGNNMLRGPVGSSVKVTLIRGNAAEPHEVTLVREDLPETQVTSRSLGNGVGLIRVGAFGPGTATAVAAEAASLQAAGATRLLVDVRATAVGAFDEAVATSRLFLASGTIVQRELRGTKDEPITASAPAKVALPVTLLTTNGTSGPAEVFVSALVGNKRATSVGERTLGRAADQSLVKLPDGSGLWITTARYLGPDGKAIQGTGLEPGVTVEEPDVEFGAEAPTTDPILEKALATPTAPPA